MVNVIGLGYIGLPTALMLAKSGIEVVGTDINKELFESLSQGKLSFAEKGLEELFARAVTNGIKFTCEYQKAFEYSEKAFEKLIEKIKEGKLDIKSLSHNSQKAYDRYSWEEMKKRIANIYNNLEFTFFI